MSYRRPNLQDIVGQKIRKLTVLKFSHLEQVQQADRVRNKFMYECQCDCGKITIVNRFHLKQTDSASATWSCGCYQKQRSLEGHEKQRGVARPHVQKPNGQSLFNTKIAAYKKGAKKRNLSWDLTDEEFEAITNKNCYYCGEPPQLFKKKDCFTSRSMNGVDRLNSTEGYSENNCVPCCKTCNYMKLDLPLDTFFAHIKKIIAHHAAPQKKEVFLITGAPGAGKSWVLSQLTELTSIDSDTTPKNKILEAIGNAPTTPVIALTVGVSTFIKNNPQFQVKLLVILEEENVLKNRILARGGKLTKTLKSRAKRMERLAKKAYWSATASEMLDFLNSGADNGS